MSSGGELLLVGEDGGVFSAIMNDSGDPKLISKRDWSTTLVKMKMQVPKLAKVLSPQNKGNLHFLHVLANT